MPELPEVETMRRYLDATSLNQDISGIKVDPSILGDVSGKRLGAILEGRRLVSTSRRGKYLFLKISNETHLIVHFGMTGYFLYYRDDFEKPDYVKLIITFEGGDKLAYSSMRKLGFVDWCDDLEAFIAARYIGPDALDPELTWERFRGIVEGRRSVVKSLLMDQRLIAGIGNLYADEILFQAGIHPLTTFDRIEGSYRKKIYSAMRRILTRSIDCQADFSRLPRSYLLGRRRKGGLCPRDGAQLQTVKLGGRTTFFCPYHQGKLVEHC